MHLILSLSYILAPQTVLLVTLHFTADMRCVQYEYAFKMYTFVQYGL